jgi:hypothetical protein
MYGEVSYIVITSVMCSVVCIVIIPVRYGGVYIPIIIGMEASI